MGEKPPFFRAATAGKSRSASAARLPIAFFLCAALAACAGAGPMLVPDDEFFAEGTEGGATTVVLDGQRVVFDRDAYARERLRELAGNDDADDDSASLRADCAEESERLAQNLALRTSLRRRDIAIESLDMTIEGYRRRLKRCLRRVEPET